MHVTLPNSATESELEVGKSSLSPKLTEYVTHIKGTTTGIVYPI